MGKRENCLNWSSVPAGALDDFATSWGNPINRLAAAPITRRKFVAGAAFGTASIAAMGRAEGSEDPDKTTDLRFDLSTDGETVTISMVRVLAKDGMPTRQRSQDARAESPLRTLVLKRAAFGPDAQFRMARSRRVNVSAQGGKGLDVRLKVLNASLARSRRHGATFVFRYDQTIEKAEDRWTVRLVTSLFAAGAKLSPLLHLGADGAAESRGIPFADFAATGEGDDAQGPLKGRLKGRVSASTLQTNLHDIFNGLARVADGAGAVTIGFSAIGLWHIETETDDLSGLAPELSGKFLTLGWVNKSQLEAQQSGNDNEAWSVLGKLVLGENEPPKITLNATDAGQPEVVLEPHKGEPLLLASGIAEDKARPPGDENRKNNQDASQTVYRTTCAYLCRLTVTTRGDGRQSGPFQNLRGLIQRRVDTQAQFEAGQDPLKGDGTQKRLDELVVYAAGSGNLETYVPERNAEDVKTPAGSMGFAIPPLSRRNGDGENDKQQKVDAFEIDPLGLHPDAPLFLRSRGTGWPVSSPDNGRRLRWLEINGQVVTSHLALPDASWSELSLHPTDLVFLCTPSQVEIAPRNYVWLGATGANTMPVRLRLDMSSARLAAARSRDLVSLRFGFKDLFLVHNDRMPIFVPQSQACGIHAETPGLRGRPGGRSGPSSASKTDQPVTPRNGSDVLAVSDERPVLVVEFPPQHLLEETFFRPSPPPLPDVERPDDPGELPLYVVAKTKQVPYTFETAAAPPEDPTRPAFEADDREAIVDCLRRLATVGERESLRQAVHDVKMGWTQNETSHPFKKFAEKFAKEMKPFSTGRGFRRKDAPLDQKIYIGPFAMDPDVAAFARQLQWDGRKAQAMDVVKGTLEAAKHHIQKLLDGGATQTSFPDQLALEASAEAALPTYQLFRAFYREGMIGLALGVPDSNSKKGSNGQKANKPKVPGDTNAKTIEYLRTEVMAGKADAIARENYFVDLFAHELTDVDDYGPAEGRLSKPSRLAFKVNCADGLARERNEANAPWLAVLDRKRAAMEQLENSALRENGPDNSGLDGFPGEHPAGIGIAFIPFSLAGLTNWASMELAVMDRAQEVFDPGPGGRLDGRSKRRLNLNGSAMLDHLDFLTGSDPQDRSWSNRANRIAASLQKAPSDWETAIEIPARLTLSPSQVGVFRAPSPVNPAIFATLNDDGVLQEKGEDALKAKPSIARIETQSGYGDGAIVPLWTTRLMLGEAVADPRVRAVHSPDLVPEFVHAHTRRLGAHLKDDTLDGAAPPRRGGFAPWFTDRKQGSGKMEEPGPWADRFIAREEGAARVPDKLWDDPQTKEKISSQALCRPGAPAKPFRDELPLLIETLCRRFGLKNFKQKEDQKYDDPRFFLSPLDARDRHELVVLSSAYGLPVRPIAGSTSVIPGAGTGQFKPDQDYLIEDIMRDQEVYRPPSLSVLELTLTALGGSFRHDTSFRPPASARHADGRNLFDALTVERWQHRTSLSRTIFCEVIYKGYLLPFMFRAALVKVTERVFEPVTKGDTVKAFLRQRMYIRVSEPTKNFPLVGQKDGGRAFPPGDVELLTTMTPDIVDPSGNIGTVEETGFRETSTGRITLDNRVGLAFWPRTLKARQGDVRFQLKMNGATSDTPLLFVDNAVANDATLLESVCDYYNGNAVPSPDVNATKPFNPLVHRRSLAFSSAKIRYADEDKTGVASLETDLITLRAEGRRLVSAGKPRRAALADNLNECQKKNIASKQQIIDDAVGRHKLLGENFNYDALLQGADQPPVYPVVETARIRLKQNETLTGKQGQLYRATYDGHYVQYGFGTAAPEAGGDDVAAPDEKEARKNGIDVFMLMLDPADQTMNDNSDQAGGIVQPLGSLIAISRKKGPVASQLKPNTIWKAEDLVRLGDRLGMAPYFAQVRGTQPIATQPEKKTSVKTRSNLDTSKVEAVLQDVFADAKILGLVELSKLVEFIGDKLGSVEDHAPGLQEITRFGADLTAQAADFVGDATDFVRQELLEPLSGIIKETIRRWEALDKDLKEAQQNPLDIGAITVAQLFPELDKALRSFDAAIDASLAEGDEIAFTISLSTVYERGRGLVDETRRATRDPIERFEAAIEGQLSELTAIIKVLKTDLKSFFDNLVKEVVDDVTEEIATAVAGFFVPQNDDEPFLTLPLPIAQHSWLEGTTGITPDDLKQLRTPYYEPSDLLDAFVSNARELQNKDVHRVLLKATQAGLKSLVDGEDLKDAARAALDVLVAFAEDVAKGEEAKIDLLVDKIFDRIKTALDAAAADYDDLLKRLEARRDSVKAQIRIYEAQLRRLKSEFKTWFEKLVDNPETAFDDPLLGPLLAEYRPLFNDVSATIADVRGFESELDGGSIPRAIGHVGSVLERHFGISLPIGDVVAPVKRVLVLVSKVILVSPVEQDPPLALCKLDTDKMIQVGDDGVLQESAVSDARVQKMVAFQNRVSALTAKLDDVADKIEKDGTLDTKGKALLNGVITVFKGIAGSGDESLAHANGELVCNLLNDASMISGMKEQVASLDSIDDNNPAALLAWFEKSGSQMRRLVAFRKAALKRSLKSAEVLSVRLKDLVSGTDDNNKNARLVLLAGGALAPLIETYGDDLKDLPSDLKDALLPVLAEAVKWVLTVAGRQGEQITAYLEGTLAGVSQALNDNQELMDDIKKIAPMFTAEIVGSIKGYGDGLTRTLGDKRKIFEAVGVVADGIDTNTVPDALSDELSKRIEEFNKRIAALEDLTSGEGEKPSLATLEADLLALIDIETHLERFRKQAEAVAFKKLDGFIIDVFSKTFLDVAGTSLSIAKLYENLLEQRNRAYDGIDGTILSATASQVLVWPVRSALKINDVDYKPAPTQSELSKDNDRLAADASYVNAIANHDKDQGLDPRLRKFALAFFDELVTGGATPLVIGEQMFELVRDLLRGNVSLTDLIDLQDVIERYINDLVPLKREFRYGIDLPLPNAVKAATLGIFAPGDECALTVDALISVDLLKQKIDTNVAGRLGAFDIKLVGEFVDALTLRFAGAEFRTKDGGGHEFDIAYLDYVIGPALSFIEDLQSWLSPGEGSGAYINPMRGIPGIEAGYKLDLGVISLGTVSFFNVSLNTAALLPFTNGGEAVFRVSLSSALSPFTISYAPFGGSGYAAIDANANGIIGFELGFAFGAAGAFAVGPLTGQGRLAAGLEIRTFKPPSQAKVTEISATFFAGGSANIWIFSFGASLYVKLGQVNGNMTGLAIFTFSFSMGIVDYDFTIEFERQENKGYSGSSGAETAYMEGERGMMIANADGGTSGSESRKGFDPFSKETAKITAKTKCLSKDWEHYLSYFEPDMPAGVIQHG